MRMTWYTLYTLLREGELGRARKTITRATKRASNIIGRAELIRIAPNQDKTMHQWLYKLNRIIWCNLYTFLTKCNSTRV